jgi:hypothetical protein
MEQDPRHPAAELRSTTCTLNA